MVTEEMIFFWTGNDERSRQKKCNHLGIPRYERNIAKGVAEMEKINEIWRAILVLSTLCSAKGKGQ